PLIHLHIYRVPLYIHSFPTRRSSDLNIIGLGIDATDIPRIEAAIAKYGERFLRRVFTEGEIAYCMRRREPAIHFAGRFAAKEAADRKSTRLNSSHVAISYAVFCLKKK